MHARVEPTYEDRAHKECPTTTQCKCKVNVLSEFCKYVYCKEMNVHNYITNIISNIALYYITNHRINNSKKIDTNQKSNKPISLTC